MVRKGKKSITPPMRRMLWDSWHLFICLFLTGDGSRVMMVLNYQGQYCNRLVTSEDTQIITDPATRTHPTCLSGFTFFTCSPTH